MTVRKKVDTSIFDKKPNFMGIFLVTSLIGIVLITLAVYRASLELEVIHEVDNMHRISNAMIGEKNIAKILGADKPAQNTGMLLGQSAYHFYIISGSGIQSLQVEDEAEVQRLRVLDLEGSRINKRGGYFKVDDQIFTWTTFTNNNSNNQLLVVHPFTSVGSSEIEYVYKKRIVIPIFFYLWLMVWVSLIFNHLLKKLKIQQKQMKHMALHDSLTSLANRSLMEDRLKKLIQLSQREKTKFALSLIDIDEFKSINDNYGHAYGDELLRQVARRLEGVLREVDTAARLGGDEFTVILSGTDEKAWRAAFDRVFKVLVEPYALLDVTVTINVSIGVAIYSVHGDDTETLLHHADKAMYAAKSDGGGVCVFEKG